MMAKRWVVRTTISIGAVLVLGLIEFLGLALGVGLDALKLRPMPVNPRSAREEVPFIEKQQPQPQADTGVRKATT